MTEVCQRSGCNTRIARSFQVTTKQCAKCLRILGRWNPYDEVKE